ncbi:NAD-dependent protein deacetylase sirtuin-7-like isoform X2 [Ornithodoros turicata]|uniref:NAD-dependent protein deacetylase sirtuin-7-like isoform X2 n=1 Tax=Ornithodoros turicata TaxID=34597 RepID=UPI0031393DB5
MKAETSYSAAARLCIQIRKLVNKPPWDRTNEEQAVLENSPELVNILLERSRKRKCNQQRQKETQDPQHIMEDKCKGLAQAIESAKCLIVYTGAGISTAAQIPDYRGPSGVWTLLQKGKVPEVQELSEAQPTFTHMAIAQLYHQGRVKHVVSQNCDGLHIRSGLPRNNLSEVHGNMFLEVCSKCKPLRQYFRLFDVTERTSLHKHRTGRKCHKCSADLIDTIVHFGERGRLRWPLNWQGAEKAANRCDAILCLGSSLKVLRRYRCLWAMDKPAKDRPKLYIVNLQWTPKDDGAAIKINGRCDDVMRRVMELLQVKVPEYNSKQDPLFKLHSPLRPKELKSFSRAPLAILSEEKDLQPMMQCQVKTEFEESIFTDHCYARKNEHDVSLKEERGSLLQSDTEDSMRDVKTELPSEGETTEEDERPTKLKRVKLKGWFGKGYAKWRARRRR